MPLSDGGVDDDGNVTRPPDDQWSLEPHDPLTLAIAALALTSVSVLAAWLPARVAARIDPATALLEG